MSIQIIRENIEVERIAGQGAVQALIEGSVILPGVSRDASPLHTDATLQVGSVEVQTDRVAMDGQVFFTLLYTAGEENNVHSVEAALNFSHILEVAGAGPKMEAQVQGNIDHVEVDIVGSKAVLRAVASLKARTIARAAIACITDIEGVDELQTQVGHAISLRTVASGNAYSPLEGEFELPFGLESAEALFAQTHVQTDQVTALEGRVEMRGQIQIEAYHRTDMFDRPIAKTRHTIPFDVSIDAPGSHGGLPAQAQAQIRDTALDLVEIDEETKQLRITMNLHAQAQVQAHNEIGQIVDAYSASDQVLDLTTQNVKMRSDMREETGIDSVKATISLEGDAPPLGVVLAAFARPAMWEVSSDNRTQAEGVLEVTILYYPAGSNQPATLREDVPFRASYDFVLPEDSWSTLQIEDVEAIQITSDRLELRCNLRLESLVYDVTEYPVALDAELLEESQPLPTGVTLYFVQPGDTLWSVAKRFRTTPEALTLFNPELAELTGNEKILLYKRLTNI